VEIEVKAIDRPRLTTEVMTLIADARIHITSIFSRTTKNNLAIMNLKVEIMDIGHLSTVMQKIRNVKDVIEVRRVLPGEVRGE
jgi:GTP pyrophosphokinase